MQHVLLRHHVSSFKVPDIFNIVSWILSAAIIPSCPSFHSVTLYLSSLPDNISSFLFFPHSPLVYVHFFYLHSFFAPLHRLSGVVNRQSALPPSLSTSLPLYVPSHPYASSSARRYNVILLQSVSRYSSHPIR